MERKPLLGRMIPGGAPMHYSVGAIIKNKEGKYLLIDRKNPPLGFACIAGHIDEGEDGATQALKREVLEESGLELVASKLLEVRTLKDNLCKRGVSNHVWHLFEAECRGTPRLEKEGAHSIGWYSQKEVQELADDGKLEPVWDFWLRRYRIVVKTNKLKPKKQENAPTTALPSDKLNSVCKIADEKNCCGFLCFSDGAWACEKATEMGAAIRACAASGGKKIKDNCGEGQTQ